MLDLFEYAKQGKLFYACNQANVTVSSLSTTVTGLILWNPPGSGVNAALMHVGGTLSTATAANSLQLAMLPATVVTPPTGITALTTRSAIASGLTGSSVCGAWNACTTTAAPVAFRGLNASSYGAGTGVGNGINEYINGSVIVPEGGLICLNYVTTAAVGIFSFCWLEYKN